MGSSSSLKKIIILTYFFPPGNFAGSYRLYSWARYLHKFGFYPIIITRHWEKDQTDYAGISTKKEIEVTTYDIYEVHSIPYNGNVRDKLKAKYGNKARIVSKFLSLIELIFQNFTMSMIPSRSLYYYARNYIKNNNDVKYLIASGKPYILFKFGYHLKQEFPYIRWIADYRDPWNTHWWLIKRMPLFVRKIEMQSEKKWLSNASAFTTCSEEWKNEIEQFIQKQGYVVFNGYENDEKFFFEKLTENDEKFSIIHNGSIYGLFNLDVFIESIKRNIDKGNNKIIVQFPGVLIDEKEGQRIYSAIKGYESYFELTQRIPHEELMNKLKNAHILLVLGTKEMGGWIPLKIFEYLITGKPILHCPGDDNIITRIINQTNTGIITQTIDETSKIIDEFYKKWAQQNPIKIHPNYDEIAKYSRENQAHYLADYISEVDLSFSAPSIPVTKTRKNLFKLGFSLKLHNVLRLSNTKSDTLILCFHDISDIPNPSYPSLSPVHFERILEYLSESYEFTTIHNLQKNTKTNKTKVLLTFDDGYKSFKSAVVPILKKYNATAICSVIVDTIESGRRFWTDRLNASLNYIYSNYPSFTYTFQEISFDYNFRIDKPDKFSNLIFSRLLEKPSAFRTEFVNGIEKKIGISFEWSDNFMNWDDIQYCVNEGMIIASHSRTHNILNTILSTEELENEIISSKKTIEEKTNAIVSVFTCPNGIYNRNVVSMAQKAGYSFMFTTEEQKTNLNMLSSEKFNLLPRISVNKSSFEENIFKINNFFTIAKPLLRQ